MEVEGGGARGGRSVVGIGDTLEDWQGGTFGGGCWGTLEAGGGAGEDRVGSGWEGCCQFWKRSQSQLMTSNFLSATDVRASLR